MSQGLKAGSFLHNKTYRIERVLGQGGFGITYLATDVNLYRKVAIKEFFPKDYCDRDDETSRVTLGTKNSENFINSLKDRFLKEARNIAKFDHSGIIRIYSAFEENNTAYYVMDYIEGESLSQRLKRTNKSFSEIEVMEDILPPVLDALEYIHNLEKPIYHLDLKPANIMIDKHRRIKLIDFGASKQISHGEESSSSSGVAYTMGYAPPEQLEGDKKKFGAYTDIYSLGATIYNLLTNEKPPQISDIITDTAADNALKLPKSPIKELIMWMMKLDRDERPQSVAEVKKFLENIKDGKSSEKVKGIKEEYKEADEITRFSFYEGGDTQLKRRNNSSPDEKKKTPNSEFKKLLEWKEILLKKKNFVWLIPIALIIIIGISVFANTENINIIKVKAELGIADAQYNLGNRYYYGTGVHQNTIEAVKWFLKAAEHGNANGQYNLGVCYYYGTGVHQNTIEAVKWFLKAAEQGHTGAKERLEKLEEQGYQVD